jgi:hypothetical protein
MNSKNQNQRLSVSLVVFVSFLALLCMVSTTQAQTTNLDVTFGWNANAESDLAGYRLYEGITPGNYIQVYDIPVSDLTDPADPEYTITVPKNIYYWALTAYDTSGNESGYSDEVDSVKPGAPGGFKVKVIVEVTVP